MAALELNSNPPKLRSIYLITYSQCDISLLSRQEFADLIIDAWHSRSRSRIIQWAVSLEAHKNGGNHFHMVVKLNTASRWLAIRNLVDSRYGIKLNFCNSHENYFTAFQYVVKEDPHFILSPGHPDLTNADPPKTTNATRQKKKRVTITRTKKKKRLSVFDVVRIIQTKKIMSRLELMALAAKWQGEGKNDLAEFISNRGPKIVNEALETAKELSEAQETLERTQKSRVQLLEESAADPCVEGCDGSWISAAKAILHSNRIDLQVFCNVIYDSLKRGRGKYRNIYIHGPANCGKTFLLSPLKAIFKCFVNPASGTFAWLGIENAEVVLLNDFRWKPSLIPWCELLQVLEGDTVHFPAPKNHANKDIVLDKDTPFSPTSDAPLALIKGGSIDTINTEMMHVRWNTFQLHRQIPKEEQKEMKACSSCFSKLIIAHILFDTE